jgi:hypothetical protein
MPEKFIRIVATIVVPGRSNPNNFLTGVKHFLPV